jgi:hypothetical protein
MGGERGYIANEKPHPDKMGFFYELRKGLFLCYPHINSPVLSFAFCVAVAGYRILWAVSFSIKSFSIHTKFNEFSFC